ncbi:MAG: malonyl CoA-acyl carrier protein transacylase [Rhizobiales bacterium NRL2]|nr:MAG: malonyl CoA-acyl carrier protein transacylase [Rhizobiales bacterium NRL2]
MARAFVFPGQGSQAVGMGGELANAFRPAREVFEEVDEALGQHLFRLMQDGPEQELVLTENAQPALMAVSMAVMRVLETEAGLDIAKAAKFVAGHSLGEYSALAAAGALELPDAARLLKRRGLAMQRAVPVGEGAMAALLGLSLEDAAAVAEEAAQGEVCSPANDNASGQVVISGSTSAIDRAVEIARGRGAKKAMRLNVSAPFHCAMMRPAAEEMETALAEVAIAAPAVPLVANVTAEPVSEPERIRALLVQQVTAMVRWRESVLYMKEQGVDELLEIGAGKVLATMTRRIDRDVQASAVNTPEDIERLVGSL